MASHLPLSFAALCLHQPIAPPRLQSALLRQCPQAVAWCRRRGSTMDVPALARGIVDALPGLLQVSVQECIARRWLQHYEPHPLIDVPAHFELSVTPLLECVENGRVTLRLALPVRLSLITLEPHRRVGLSPQGDVLRLPAHATWTARGWLAVHDHASTGMPLPDDYPGEADRAFHAPSAQKLRLPFDRIELH